MESNDFAKLLSIRGEAFSEGARLNTGMSTDVFRARAALYRIGDELSRVLLRTRKVERVTRTRVEVVTNRYAWWLGAHYSRFNRRLCITVFPCVTVAITFKGGVRP